MMLDGFRQELVKTLDAPCMLRVCREDDCLFVTDFPGRFPEKAGLKKTALEEAGFDVRPSGRLWRIDPGRAMWDAFIESFPREELPDPMDVPLPLYSLARRLTGKTVPAAGLCSKRLMRGTRKRSYGCFRRFCRLACAKKSPCRKRRAGCSAGL